MSAFAITPPYPVFTNIDGDPLDGGKIYVGVANLNPVTNPVQLYWDEALTITASQPILTSGGYAVRSGTPSLFYAAVTPVSITVKDAQDVTVFTRASVSGVTADMVSYGNITVAEALDNALYDVSFGVVADGVTDDSAATNLFLAALAERGGTGMMKPGVRIFNSQVVFEKQSFSKRCNLMAYGVTFKPTHAGSALQVSGGGAEGGGLTIEGAVVDVVGNTTTTKGFDNFGATFTKYVSCGVIYQTANAAFEPFTLRNSVASNDDTGSFWCLLDGCTVRQVTGDVPTYCDAAVTLRGQANHTIIRGCQFNTVDIGVLVTTEPGQLTNSNSVLIDSNAFESLGTCVQYTMSASGQAAGLVVSNNRAELFTDVFAKFVGGVADGGAMPPHFMGNHFTPGTSPKYITCDPLMNYTSLDAQVTALTNPAGMATLVNRRPLELRAGFNDDHALQVVAQGLGFGWILRLFNGGVPTTVGRWITRASSGSVFGGASSGQLAYGTFIGGLSSGTTEARNLTGTVTLSSGVATVTFATAEADTSYRIALGSNANETIRWTAKSTGGFSITSSNASSTAVVDWILMRNN